MIQAPKDPPAHADPATADVPSAPTLGSRIRGRREALGLTQEKLAGLCGVSRAAVAQWESGVTRPSLDNLVKSAEALGVWLSWLTAGDQSLPDGPNPFAQPARPRVLPVLVGRTAAVWPPMPDAPARGAANAGDEPDTIAADPALSSQAFAFAIRDDSMAPEFRDGDRVILDPAVSPLPGDFVIAKLETESEAIFRKYRLRTVEAGGTHIELAALNQDWPVHVLTTENPGRIVGTMVEHRRYRRRPA